MATAAFSVLGPTNVNVSAQPSDVAMVADVTACGKAVTSVVWGTETTQTPTPGKPFNPGISFLATAVEPGPPGKPIQGKFYWEQLIISGSSVYEYINTTIKKSDPTGLDNFVFFLAVASSPFKDPDTGTNNYAWDAPTVPLNGRPYKITRDLSAITYLMWQPSMADSMPVTPMPDSIPVTLGYVQWSTEFGCYLGLYTFAHGTKGAFFPQTDYPTWQNVVQNGPCP